jgi:hypothetical protein
MKHNHIEIGAAALEDVAQWRKRNSETPVRPAKMITDDDRMPFYTQGPLV